MVRTLPPVFKWLQELDSVEVDLLLEVYTHEREQVGQQCVTCCTQFER